METRDDASGPPVQVTFTALPLLVTVKVTFFCRPVVAATAGGGSRRRTEARLKPGRGRAGYRGLEAAGDNNEKSDKDARQEISRLISGRWGGIGDKGWGIFPRGEWHRSLQDTLVIHIISGTEDLISDATHQSMNTMPQSFCFFADSAGKISERIRELFGVPPYTRDYLHSVELGIPGLSF